MKNIKIILEYDGTGFSGWQFQPRQRTLQGTLEDAIKATTGEELRVTASGRTDAGVHAYGQAVNFKTESNLDTRAWLGALNLSHDFFAEEAAVHQDRRHRPHRGGDDR